MGFERHARVPLFMFESTWEGPVWQRIFGFWLIRGVGVGRQGIVFTLFV